MVTKNAILAENLVKARCPFNIVLKEQIKISVSTGYLRWFSRK